MRLILVALVASVTAALAQTERPTENNSSLNIEGYGRSDLKYNLLLGCLILFGVNSQNIHHRDSGLAYDKLNFQWNSLNGCVKPLAYLVATHVSDVQRAVTCCGLSKVRLVARSGGHSYIKSSFGDSSSLVVDLTKLNQISVDPMQMTCEIGAGARIGQVLYTLWKNGNFLIPTGICPTVGIAGLTLGGGYGRFTTLFGLTSDSVEEIEMVDARGDLLIINNSTNTDLFWALRGGGGGNFGIVTKFKFRMYKAPSSSVFIRTDYNFEDFAQFFSAWQMLITSGIPRHLSLVFKIIGDSIAMGFYGYNFEQQNETDVSSMTKFLSSFPFPSARSNSSRLMSYEEILVKDSNTFSAANIQNVSQLGNINYQDSVVGWKKMRSMFVDRSLNESQIATLKDLIGECLQYSNISSHAIGIIAEPQNSAVNSLSPSDTAFIHREPNLYLLQVTVFTPPNEHPNIQADRTARMFYEKSKSVFHHRESYQNYMDQDIGDYLVRYYGSNLNRLVSIKKRYDPENVFHHPQSIPVRIDLASGK